VSTAIPPIGTISTTPATGTTTTATTASKDATDKDLFLKLLVAQMKYQDPSKPTDSSQYLSQMAQYSMVEKLNDLSDSQAAMSTSSQLQSAVAMVGAMVEYGSGDTAGSGKVTGVTVVSGVPQLLIGDDKVPMTDVTKVTEATA
jgi:flagellar basal-body rod modification protein FlgD